MARQEFSRKIKAAIIARAAGKCEKCSAVLKTSEGEVDHILPDALGGKPEIANGWLLCRVCHVEKTGHDIRRVRKADRQRDRQTGALAAVAKIKSAPFQKSTKSSRRQEHGDRPALPFKRLFAEAREA